MITKVNIIVFAIIYEFKILIFNHQKTYLKLLLRFNLNKL